MVCTFPQATHVVEHDRKAHSVRGHFKNRKTGRIWFGEHPRSGSTVREHCRS